MKKLTQLNRLTIRLHFELMSTFPLIVRLTILQDSSKGNYNNPYILANLFVKHLGCSFTATEE